MKGKALFATRKQRGTDIEFEDGEKMEKLRENGLQKVCLFLGAKN